MGRQTALGKRVQGGGTLILVFTFYEENILEGEKGKGNGPKSVLLGTQKKALHVLCFKRGWETAKALSQISPRRFTARVGEPPLREKNCSISE